MRYAKDTVVSVEKSRAEIEATLSRYGADCFGYLTSPAGAQVAFRAHHRMLRFVIPLPTRDAPEFKRTPVRKNWRSDDDAYRAWEQACRQRWRALSLAIKAKLEAVESGISTFEAEFLAHIVLPGGETVGSWLGPQIERAYATQQMPPPLALPGPDGAA